MVSAAAPAERVTSVALQSSRRCWRLPSRYLLPGTASLPTARNHGGAALL